LFLGSLFPSALNAEEPVIAHALNGTLSLESTQGRCHGSVSTRQRLIMRMVQKGERIVFSGYGLIASRVRNNGATFVHRFRHREAPGRFIRGRHTFAVRRLSARRPNVRFRIFYRSLDYNCTIVYSGKLRRANT